MALVALGLTVAACSRSEDATAAKDGNFIVDTEADKAAEAATVEATRSLPVFWSTFEKQPPGAGDFLVKLGLPVGDGRVENIWADLVRKDGDKVVVRLANDPVWLKGVQNGSEVTAPVGQIVDWSYSKGGKAFGHFSTRALMNEAGPAERAEAQAFLAPTPLEPDPS